MKALCPASSTTDKTVCQVLSLSPVPASHDNHRSKMSAHACSHWWGWSVLAILITKLFRPSLLATRLQSAATSRIMNFLMAWKEGVESVLNWVCVSVEGETRVGGINHFNCVKLHTCA